jgi:phosphoribosyl 1,2-cyclic phosphodiesterase
MIGVAKRFETPKSDGHYTLKGLSERPALWPRGRGRHREVAATFAGRLAYNAALRVAREIRRQPAQGLGPASEGNPPLSVRICVLGSGSRGNSTLIATEKTRLLVDAGFSRRETFARLASVGERADRFHAVLISHEHSDHIRGLDSLTRDPACRDVPIFINAATRDAISWGHRAKAFELFEAGEKFTVGDIEITPFTVPHDAADPVAFRFETQGIRIGVVTDLGCIPELVKRHVAGCHCLIFESNHDLEMLKMGPYPWVVKQRVMSRHGHLSNLATAEFLRDDFDGEARVLVLAHLSENNNHPEIARMSAVEALRERLNPQNGLDLHLASQTSPTKVFQF